MTTNTHETENGIDLDDLAALDARDVRALTEAMSVMDDVGDARDAPGLYLVVGENGGGEYVVDTADPHPRCTCPDDEYNLDAAEPCKHYRRVMFETGARPIPVGVDPDAVDDHLGVAVDGGPRVATPASRVATDGGEVIDAGDDGVLLDETDDVEDTGGRPDDCQCTSLLADEGVPCWPCFRDGFEMPADVDD
jgi:hypothetical protein